MLWQIPFRWSHGLDIVFKAAEPQSSVDAVQARPAECDPAAGAAVPNQPRQPSLESEPAQAQVNASAEAQAQRDLSGPQAAASQRGGSEAGSPGAHPNSTLPAPESSVNHSACPDAGRPGNSGGGSGSQVP